MRFVIVLFAILLMSAEAVKVQGSIWQENIPVACVCGKVSNTIEIERPTAVDCIPHIIVTLDCSIYSYNLVAWACTDYIGLSIDGLSEDDTPESCQMDYEVGSSCRMQAVNGLCMIQMTGTVQDLS